MLILHEGVYKTLSKDTRKGPPLSISVPASHASTLSIILNNMYKCQVQILKLQDNYE